MIEDPGQKSTLTNSFQALRAAIQVYKFQWYRLLQTAGQQSRLTGHDAGSYAAVHVDKYQCNQWSTVHSRIQGRSRGLNIGTKESRVAVQVCKFRGPGSWTTVQVYKFQWSRILGRCLSVNIVIKDPELRSSFTNSDPAS